MTAALLWRLAREATAWLLYGAGDLLSRLSDLPLPPWLHYNGYRLYSAVMCLSDDVQGTGRGPWSDPSCSA